MDVGESRTFIISRKRYKPQPGRQACGLTSKTFEVRKFKGEMTSDTLYGEMQTWLFYAISGTTAFNEVHESTESHKYHGQVAYIKCKHGWIDDLKVFKQILGEYQGLGSRPNPNGCGIGVVLTELCLIDPEFNNMNDNSRAIKRLSDTPEMQELVMRNCVRLVALIMAATPTEGAHVYFSAAIRMGYTHMIVDVTTRNERDFVIYETQIARQNFNFENADIQPCCGMDLCNTYGRTWYFCAENRKTLGPRLEDLETFEPDP